MEEKYQVAEVYSVPLTQSAAKEAPESDHRMFVDFLDSHLEKMFGTNGCLSGSGSYKELSAEKAKETKRLATAAKFPDLFYASDHVVALGEAKSNAPDLTNSHTDSQIVDYVKEMKEEYPNHKKVLMLSAPYGIHGLLRQKLQKIRRMQGEDFFDGIHIEFVSEITDKEVKEPEGWNQLVEEPQSTSDIAIIDGKVVPVKDMFIPIDNLVFDSKNARLLGFDCNQALSQEECYYKLLADGNSKNKNEAVYRRIRMVDEGCIHTPVIVRHLGNGKYLVYDGNSRVAFARDIIEQAAKAEGYRFIRAKVFPAGTDEDTLESYKQKIQSDVILEHGMIQDVADIYRKHEMGLSDEEIMESFGNKYSLGIVKGAYNAVIWLKKLGVTSDERIAKYYMAAYRIGDVTPARKSTLKNKDIELEDVMKRLIDFGGDEGWLNNSNLDMLVKVINNRRQSWKLEALKGFVDGDPKWSTVSAWKKNMAELEEQNTKQVGIDVALKQAQQSNTQVTDLIEYLTGMIESLNESDAAETDATILEELSKTKSAKLRKQLKDLGDNLEIAVGKLSEVNKLRKSREEEEED